MCRIVATIVILKDWKYHPRGNISYQLRTLEKLQISLGVQKFSDAIDRTASVKMIEAIKRLARGSSDKNFTDHLPNLPDIDPKFTYFSQCCESYRCSVIKENERALETLIQIFIDC